MPFPPRTIQSLTLALLLASASLTAAQTEELRSPAGPESLAPSFASLGDGSLVLTWLEPAGEGHALKFSVLDGDQFGPARTIASGERWFANWADTPGLFVLPNGDWVAHWLVKSGPSTYAYDVVSARSSDGGESWGDPVSPHRDGTQTEHGFVSYFAQSPAAAGMVWLDGRRMADEEGEGAMTLRTATVSADGGLSDETLLDERVCDCCQTASAMTSQGPIVVYRGRSEEEIRDHYVARRTGDGWTEPELLHADNWRIGGCPVNGPAMVTDGERVAVAWFTMPEGTPQIRVAVSRDNGETFDLIDTLGVGTAQGRVDLALSGRGFLLSWIDQEDRSGVLRVAGYDWRGQRQWGERIAGLDAGRASGFPRLGVQTGCRPVVTWTGRQNDERRVRVIRLAAQPDCKTAPNG